MSRHYVCAVADVGGTSVTPEGRRADAVLRRDTDSYVWAYESQQCACQNQINVRTPISCKSAILSVMPPGTMPRCCAQMKTNNNSLKNVMKLKYPETTITKPNCIYEKLIFEELLLLFSSETSIFRFPTRNA
jgi:hypothetical protein